MKRTILLLLFVGLFSTLLAQKSDLQTGGVYYAYPVPDRDYFVPAPSGYKLVYLSHYGRHGSRWMTNERRYSNLMAYFDNEKNLTRKGRRLKKTLQPIVNRARGNAGKLSPLGEQQQRQLAIRISRHFEELLGPGARVQARSSIVDRCAKSMQAFCAQLQACRPGLNLDMQTNKEDMEWISHESPDEMLLKMDDGPRLAVTPDRLLQSLFKDPSQVKQPQGLLVELHTLVSDEQDMDSISNPRPGYGQSVTPRPTALYGLFTPEELQAVYELNCQKMFHQNGPDPSSHGIPAQCAAHLWQNIVTEADRSLAGQGPSVCLRFGHDTALYRLLTLLGITTRDDGLPWTALDEVVPMAANLQMPFYRNAEGDVLVRFYLNERPVTLHGVRPVTTEGGAPAYRWKDLKNHFQSYLDRQKWQERTRAINTLVGTDRATTQPMGRYGKGSEEHGQNLPAVLEPHGMNFWTPQTRDGEQKCVAPYYYADSLFQGFRCSHWLVGGCTQDYGSFTLTAETGKLRLSANDRATRFSHKDEIAHPYYYAVYLPDEHLMTEMTGRSRSALFRFMPDAGGDVHIVVQANSDYGEGFVSVDTLHRRILGYNPVHRIYQGWGEKAGFNGWFVVEFDRPFDSWGVTDSVAHVTFHTRPGDKLLVKAASSFTDWNGALKNLEAEIPHWDFLAARTSLDSIWQQQLQTIVVEDTDEQRVSEFYGALYRTSFLPHVISDVDGAHPAFGNGQQIVRPQAARDFYSDYSLWDIYRAQMPLLALTDTARCSDMMQSLTEMYVEGGWMPIFPCWNSYTAAMIGDHATAAIADAWVKGCRNFDIEKAYEGLRQNAFSEPASRSDYLNGMGRRALRSYLKWGYIPLEDSVMEAFHTHEQVSRTLEYAFDDFCLAQLAKALGKTNDYAALTRRAANWRNAINPRTGWADARHANKRWLNNRNLTERQPFITEGSVMHYSFSVPQDIPGLMKVMGGRQAFVARLDTLFGFSPAGAPIQTAGEAAGDLPTGQRFSPEKSYYWHGNEPCHHIAYLYALAGQPWKTQLLVNKILTSQYADAPGGLAGNDDAGQTSAWQVFSMMGFYPVCPATKDYVIGTPALQKVVIGPTTILTERPSSDAIYIQSMTWNGKPYSLSTLSNDLLRQGGTLKVVLGTKPVLGR